MKKIGIMSDTHSCWDDRFAQHFAECDEIWHAGDIGDVRVLKNLQRVAPVVRAVAGNIDIRSIAPKELAFDVEGVRVYMTHISPRCFRPADGRRVNVVVTGHSHILKVYFDRSRDVLCINPGAAGNYGWQPVSTLVRLTIDGQQIRDLEVIELSR